MSNLLIRYIIAMAWNFGTVGTSDLILDEMSLGFKTVAGDDQIAQGVRNNLSVFQGEWWIEPTKGVPYLQQILGQTQPDLSAIRAVFTRAILGSKGIASLTKLSTNFVPSTRAYTVEFEAITINGTTITDTVST